MRQAVIEGEQHQFPLIFRQAIETLLDRLFEDDLGLRPAGLSRKKRLELRIGAHRDLARGSRKTQSVDHLVPDDRRHPGDRRTRAGVVEPCVLPDREKGFLQHFLRRFAEGIQAKFPGKMLAYNCSPSFNWKKNLDDETIAKFQRELGAMGYKFQFVTLAGFHSLNHSMFELSKGYRESGMAAYSALQQAEFGSEVDGYSATRHQREVGTGYFDEVAQVLSSGASSTLALEDSTEAAQF